MSKPHSHRVQPFRRRLLQVAVASCFATAAHANPVGPSVVSGAATFNAVGKNLTVTNSPGAIINWQGFSIRPDEVTRFVQSGAASAVLNRVTGPEHSAILGQLASNGRVFLINPNGVTVGAGARIDTAGFVASSLNLSNEDFLAGKFRFTDPGNAGKVTNAGTINAHSGGPVYLVAPTVENHGVITAPGGDVILAAGKTVELVSLASPDIRVQVQAGGEALNVGHLVAQSGRVGIFGAAIRNAGVVSADSATVTPAGTIVLKASTDVTLEATSALTANGAKGGAVTVQAEGGTLLADGRVEAKGTQGAGGEVKLLGDRVGLVGQASVDASGATGGGTVLVGGDYQGKNPEIQNAKSVVLTSDATITADATARGDGGRVILWSDEYTGFYGAISARGGAQGGNGGFVETSSKANLQAMGIVDAAAPAGRAGEWLLDPSDVTITTSTSGGTFGGGSPNVFTPTAAAANANAATINTSLNAGTSVTINTASAAAGNGDIIVNSAISKTTNTGTPTLTLNAVRDITVNAAMQGSAAGNVLNVALNAGRALAFGGGGSINTRNGNVAVTAGTTASLGAINTGTGTLSLTANGAVTQTGALTIGGTATFAPGAGNSVTLATATNNFATVVFTDGANATIRDSNALVFGNTSLTGTLTASAGGAITDTGTIAVGGLASFKTLVNAGAAITLDTAANSFGSLSVQARNAADTANAAGAITVTKNGALTLETVGTTANATFSAGTGGNITQTGTGTVTVGGTATFTPGAGNSVTLTTATNNFGTVAQTNGANLTVVDSNAIIFGATTLTGTLNVTAGGNVTQSGVVTAPTLTASLSGAASQLNLGTLANNIASLGPVTAPGGVTINNGNNATTVNGNIGTTNGAVTINTGTAAAGYTQNDFDIVAGSGNVTINANAVNIAANTGNNAFQTTGTLTLQPNTAATTMSLAAAAPSTFDLSAAEITAITAGAGTPTNIVIGNATNSTAAMTIGAPVDFGAGRTVTLNAGSFTDGAVAGRTITAGTLNLNARTGAIGAAAAGAIDVAVTNLRVNTVNQSAFINATGGVNFGPGGSATGTGSLTYTGAGNVTQSGALTIGGTSSFNAGAGAITLTNAANNFTGAVSAANTGANAIQITDANAIQLGTINTANNLTVTGVGITQNAGGLTVGGASTFNAGAGVITLTTATNNFTGAVSLNNSGANNVAVTDANAIVLGTSSVGSGTLAVTATGANSITQAGALTQAAGAGAATFTTGAGAITLTQANDFTGAVRLNNTGANDASVTDANSLTLGSSTVGRNLTAVAGAGLTLAGTLTTGATSGTSIELVGQSFTNTAGGAALAPGAGSRFLLWSSNPNPFGGGTPDNRGGIAYDFKQYNATFGVTPPAQAAGNGVLYTLAPTVTPGLTGTVSKVYDTTTTATLAPANYTVSGVVDGDTVTLNNPAGGAYDNKNVGTAKNVSVSGIAITSATNGAAPVYGYQLGSTSANANIGDITAATLVGNITAANKVYDATPAATITGRTLTGVIAGDTVSYVGGTASFADKNVGTAKTVTGTSLSLAGADAGNYTVNTTATTTADITPAPLTIAGDNKARLYGDPNPPLTATFTGLVGGETPAVIPGLTVTTPATIVSNVGNYAINVGSGANANYTITYVNGQLMINPAPLTIAADDKTKTAGQPNPPFTATSTGFKLGQTVADLTGTLSFTTPATTVSPAGLYTITPSGVSSGNYTITFVNGQLVVTGTATPPSALGGVATADNALITATQRSESSPTEGLQPDAPLVRSTDCLVIDTPAGRRVLDRCF